MSLSWSNNLHIPGWQIECKWPQVRQGPRSSIRMVIGIFCSDIDTVFVQLNQYSQILRRQCCLPPPHFDKIQENDSFFRESVLKKHVNMWRLCSSQDIRTCFGRQCGGSWEKRWLPSRKRLKRLDSRPGRYGGHLARWWVPINVDL